MKKICLLCILSLYQLGAMAQSGQKSEVPEFETDRPERTQTPKVVPKGFWQLETGFEYERGNQDGNKQKAWMYPQGLLRIGLFSKAELRLEASYNKEKTYNSDILSGTEIEDGLHQVRIGTKIYVLPAQGIRPDIGILVLAELPWGNDKFTTNHVAPEVRLLFNNKITEKVNLQYNVAYHRKKEDEEMENDVEYSAALSGKLSEKLTLFGEFYGEKAPHHHAENHIDGGVHFKLLPILQLDAFVGTGLSHETPELFAGGGISMRLPR